jgi:uncharacterized protein (UPF0335 family)
MAKKQARVAAGHNAGDAAERLKNYVQRIERLTEERDAISEDIKEIYVEVKSAGFDTKILRQVIRRRKMDAADRQEQDALLEMYEKHLGIFA